LACGLAAFVAEPAPAQPAAAPTDRFPKAAAAYVVMLDGRMLFKTGFTSRAGKCLIALAERDGHRVLAVLLDAPDRWWSADAMLREAFDVAAAAD